MRTLLKLINVCGLGAGLSAWWLYLLKKAAKKFPKQDHDLLVLLARLTKTAKPGILACTITLNGRETKLLLRKDTSDFSVCRQVLIQLEYQPLIDFISSNNFDRRPIKHIVDIGANIGLTTTFFHAHFPTAQIIALEPEPGNYRMLAENLRQNCGNQVIAIQAALWSTVGLLKVDKSFRDGLAWSFRMEETTEIQDAIPGYTLPDLMQDHSVSEIDILKIDVEGGEVEIFKNEKAADAFLCRTRFISLETHDEVASAPLVEAALRRNNFITFRTGETLFGVNMALHAVQD